MGKWWLLEVKNGSLKFDIRDDGVYVEIRPANTTAGNDMYELVRTGILTKMSFPGFFNFRTKL